MSSKAHFKKGGQSASKLPTNSIVSGTSTKKNAGTIGGNDISNAGRANIQVIFNGKIATPMSLLVRAKSPLKQSTTETKQEVQKANVVTKEISGGVEEEKADKHNFPPKPSANTRSSMIGKAGSSISNTVSHQVKKKELGVVMTMTETDTIETFSMASFIVATDSQVQMQILEERAERYEKTKQSHDNPDGFLPASTQTLNNTQKDQNEAAVPTPLQDNGCQALSFEINDATSTTNKFDFNSVGVGTEESTEDPAGLPLLVRQFVTDSVNMALVSPGCLLDTTSLVRPTGSGESKPKKKRDPAASGVSGTVAGSSTNGTSIVGGGSSVIVGASGTNVGGMTSNSGVNAGGDIVDAHDHASTQAVGVNATEDPIVPVDSEADGAAILFHKRAADILASENLLKRLQMIERAAQQNAFHRKQLDYRDLPDVKPLVLTSEKDRGRDDKAGGLGGLSFGVPAVVDANAQDTETNVIEDDDGPLPATKKLFTYFNSDLVRGRSVTTMVWNKVNQDLLAVGYGKLDTFTSPYKVGEAVDEEMSGGLVLFWSLRNPEYPEKVLRTPSPVTAMEFSRLSPMLLAVGLQSGDMNIYDVKRDGADWSIPVDSSSGLSVGLGHTDAIWQVKWVPRGAERVETLVSISSDGRVLQWSIKKGLTVSCLMRLARSGQTDGWISRQASGICFDFCPVDPTIYFVGTEEGSLHKCSVSYSEQYLETYVPHSGPVYKVKCSPHWPQLFLTCSADWTIGLHHMNVKQRSIFHMRASGEDFAVTDVSWCPDNSTVFAAVTQNGILQIWDLSVSCLDPVVSYDTSQDQIVSTKKEEVIDDEDLLPIAGTRAGTAQSLPPGAPHGRNVSSAADAKEEAKVSRIQRLVRNLEDNSSDKTLGRRVLTSVAFCERAPAVVVGDSGGALTVYRIIDPVIITHMGPIQQTEKMKAAIAALDPSFADLLNAEET